MIRIALAACLAIAAAWPARAAVEIQEVTSPGGITAWLVEEHSIPFTALEIRFKGGASLEAPGKRGAINLMTWMLEEGSGEMDSQAFAAAQEALAAKFDFDIGNDTLSVSAKFLTEIRDASVDLLKTALTDPTFPAEAMERVRAQALARIRSDATDPEEIAWDAFDRAAFGDHPYGSDKVGTLESVAALTRDDLFDAHDRVLTKDHLYVSAVGDITPEELGALLDTLLGELPDEGASYPPMAELGIEGGVNIVPFDTPQSVAVFGHAGIRRDDPDFFAAFVLNQILGGGDLSSRLFTEVREKRGLTYGVYTYLADWDYAKLLMGQVQSANDKVAEAISVIRDEWAKVAETGVTAEELEDAKTYLTGAYPLRFDGNGRIARILVGMQLSDLPIDYIETRNDKVEAVTLEDVKRVAARLMRPEDLHFTVVGQPVGLEATN
ncbi:pitrilysin family protein [Psychromarinibacter sp. C21-152]|uniref:Pitrilysin family protein n=1 Tax=Psychromarinibacter sediminicola TaxID=3033385 RepID=A0AAE3NUC0_9RHOB|nr:pitrilysin family protein [Psychromarinibacter sediminicola]MDF0601814.1 pitrilysin family protein [Psychromarinibacter sediminicola]